MCFAVAYTCLKGNESKAAARVEGTPAVTNLQEISETVCDHVTQGHLQGVCVRAKTSWEVECEKQTKWSSICGSRSHTRDAYCPHTLVRSILYNTRLLWLYITFQMTSQQWLQRSRIPEMSLQVKTYLGLFVFICTGSPNKMCYWCILLKLHCKLSLRSLSVFQ